MKTAALIIIGNEILTAKFADENSPYLLRRLRELGVSVRRVAVVPDVVEAIADEVRRCSATFELVFTTGGVGPTHDDITMESIAVAFETGCEVREELVETMRKKLRAPLSDAVLRMARVPKGAELWWDGELAFPLVVKGNVHILPGVPSILRLKFEAVADRFRSETTLATARVVTRERESAIAPRLETALERWPSIEIGSYPRHDEGPRHVIIIVESLDGEEVEAAARWLGSVLDPLEP
ncbi:MAG TPA: molybdopterin-binding protein [Myxococcota bacterium]|nr:molybdopterin-binding protein [Myxococcota bacterium]